MVVISTLKQKRGFPIPPELGKKHKLLTNVFVIAPGRNPVSSDIHKEIKEDSLYKLFLKEKGFSEESDGKEEKKVNKQADTEAKDKSKAKVDAAKLEKDSCGTLRGQIIKAKPGIDKRTLTGKNSIQLQAMLVEVIKV